LVDSTISRPSPLAVRQHPFVNPFASSVHTDVSPLGETRNTSPSSCRHSPESVTKRLPVSSKAAKFGTRIRRSDVPFEYELTSPAGVTRTTSARPKSQPKTLPSASRVTPYRKPSVVANWSKEPSFTR
jgi:hypothetical protein